MNIRVDCACPRSRHTHGTRAAYTKDRCRCFPCRVAHDQLRHAGTWTEGGYVNPCGTVRRLRALHAAGWSFAAIGVQLGASTQAVHQQAAGDRAAVYAVTAARVADVYDRLWAAAPPSGTQFERAAITRAKARAASRGWAPPMAWDDETIDVPSARPSGVRRAA